MNSKKMDFGSKDLISSLPDALVCHILSFLSTTDAALTSVLSKRWKNLLALVPNLDLDNSIYDHPGMGRRKRLHLRKSFKLFINRVMALQENARLNKFALRCKIGSDPSIVNGWILNVLERGVVDLDLYIASKYNYPLPPKVLMSKTLVRLKLAGTDEFTINVEEVFLPKLKTLYLDDVSFKGGSGAGFANLISGCLALEELILANVIWQFRELCTVSNPNLKRVTISCQDIDEIPKSVSFDTPNLVYLEFSDTIAVKYPKTNFDSLVEASIGLRMQSDKLFDARDRVEAGYGYSRKKVGDAAGFLMGISNVKILYLSTETLEVLAFCCKTFPVFNNLIHLTIETHEDVEWEALPNLLKNCPNLETLVVNGLHYRDTNQCMFESHRFKDTTKCWEKNAKGCVCKPWAGTPIWLSSCPVKMIKVLMFGEISGYKDDMDRQMDLIKHFLETMPNLGQVVLYSDRR